EASGYCQQLAFLDTSRAVGIVLGKLFCITFDDHSWDLQPIPGGLQDIACLKSREIIVVQNPSSKGTILSLSNKRCNNKASFDSISPLQNKETSLEQGMTPDHSVLLHWDYSFSTNVLSPFSIIQVSPDSNFEYDVNSYTVNNNPLQISDS